MVLGVLKASLRAATKDSRLGVHTLRSIPEQPLTSTWQAPDIPRTVPYGAPRSDLLNPVWDRVLVLLASM